MADLERSSMANLELTDQGGPFTHLDQLVRFANSVAVADGSEPKRLLDLRCGTGTLIRAFAPHGWEAVGLDSSQKLMDAARELQPESMHAEFLLESEQTEIDLRDKRFDLIVAFDDLAEQFLEPVHLERLVNLASERLLPGGHLVFHLERTTAFSTIDARLDTLRRCGFDTAWRTTPGDLTHVVSSDVDHGGTRDLFVARKNT